MASNRHGGPTEEKIGHRQGLQSLTVESVQNSTSRIVLNVIVSCSAAQLSSAPAREETAAQLAFFNNIK